MSQRLLSVLVIYSLKTLTIISKLSNPTNLFKKKRNFILVSNNILKICCGRLDFLD